MKTVYKIMLAIATIMMTAPANAGDNSQSALMMEMDGKIYFYLLDAKGEPMSNKDVEGKASFKLVAGSKVKVKLSRYGETGFVANEAVGDFTKGTATFSVKNVNVNTRFKNTYSDGTEGKKYVCPMHPAEMMENEGKCPKCGMGMTARTIKTYKPEKSNRR